MANTVRIWIPTPHTAHRGLPMAGANEGAAAIPTGLDRYGLCDRSAFADPAAAHTSQLAPDPSRERYLLGLLARTAEKGMVLGVTTYLAGHQGLAKTIAHTCGEITAFEWCGELMMPADPGRLVSVVRLNETSGYLHQYRGTAPVRNRAETAARVFTDASGGLFPHARAEVVPYAPGHEHLDPILSGITGNFRHTYGAKFMIVGGMLAPITKGAVVRLAVANLARDFPTEVAALQALINIIVRDEPGRASQFHKLQGVLASVQTQTVLRRARYQPALTELKTLEALYRGRCLQDHGNTYDLYVHERT